MSSSPIEPPFITFEHECPGFYVHECPTHDNAIGCALPDGSWLNITNRQVEDG